MEETKVVHCKKEKYDIYIGRPSKWGNPFSHKEGTSAKYRCNTREEAVKNYEIWIKTQSKLINCIKNGELNGKVLGCWCKPKLCHGDILVKLNKELYLDKVK